MMAELSLSGASTQGASAVPEEDGDFEPSADMLVHDFDDEQTLEEEEMLQGETNFSTEIEDLTREGEMPIHELLKMYGYGGGNSPEEYEETEEQDTLEKKTAQGKVKAVKLLCKENKESCEQEEDLHSSSNQSAHCKRSLGTAQLIYPETCSYFDGNDGDESEDEDYIPSEEWKKEVKVGPMFQAETPVGLCKYDEDEKAYENDDQLLWNPELLPENEVVEFLAEASKRTGDESGVEVIPDKPLIKDNEQALYELVKCNFDKEEALSQLKFNITPTKEELLFWAEEEHRDFDEGDKADGNDYSAEDGGKQIKLWRRKPSLHPGMLDSTLRETANTEVSQEDIHPVTSSCSDNQLKSENSNTTHNDADSQSTEQPLACVSDRTGGYTNGSSHSLHLNIVGQPLNSSSKPDTSSSSREPVKCLVRQREEDEGSENPLKRQKTDVDLLMTAAVSGSRMEAV